MNRIAILLLLLSAALAGSADGIEPQNLLNNSSFELGADDYACIRYLDMSDSPVYLPPEIDSTTAVHGKCSLKFSNPNNDTINFQSHEIKLDQGKSYTLSFWMKSDKPGLNVKVKFFSIAHDPPKIVNHWWAKPQEFTVGTAWQRYVFTMTPPKDHDYFMVDFRWGNNSGGSTAWLDAIQINAGSTAPPYQPRRDVEMVFAGIDRLWVKGISRPETWLKAVNYTGQPRQIEADVIDYDYYFKRAAGTEKQILTIPANTAVTVPVKSGSDGRIGAFRIEGQFSSGDVVKEKIRPFYYAVIGEYIRQPVDPGRDILVGIEDNAGRGNDDVAMKDISFRASGYGADERFRLMALDGIRLLRIGNYGQAFSWREIEPEKGQFNWADSDRYVAAAEKHGMKLMPVLGNTWIHRKNKTWNYELLPDWIYSSSKISPAGSGLPSDYERVEPPEDAWRDYVAAIINRYKGRITYWEILNEPNLYLTEAIYVKYLKIAYETAKKIDPACKIVAFCATGDFGGKLGSFIEQCGRIDAMQYADVVSFHPYGARNDNTPVTAMSQDSALRRLVDRFKPGIPLWNTEIYYLFGTTSDDIMASKPAAHHLARRFLIDTGEGVGQAICLPFNFMWVNDLQPNWGYLPGDVLRKPVPSPIFVMQNALARFVEGAKPVEAIKWRSDIFCYLYRDKSGQPLAAFWSPLEPAGYTLVLHPGKVKIELFDLFGNPLAGNGEECRLQLSVNPVFLRSSASVEEIRSILAAAVVIPDRPYSFNGARYSWHEGKAAMAVELHNRSSQPGNFTLRLSELPAPLKTTEARQKIALPGNASTTVYFPLPDADLFRPLPAGSAKLLISDGQQVNANTVDVKPRRYCGSGQSIIVNTADAIKKGSGEWQGERDCSFQFSTCYDSEYWRLTIKVSDDKRGGRSAENIWDGDAMELFIDTAPDQQLGRDEYTENVYRLFIAPAAANGLKAELQGSKNLAAETVKWEIIEHDGGYDISLAIPWRTLHLAGPTPLAFDIAINDADGEKRKLQMTWSGTAENFKDRSGFGQLSVASPQPPQ